MSAADLVTVVNLTAAPAPVRSSAHDMTPQHALAELFLRIFSTDELRIFLGHQLPEGATLASNLPGATASPRQVAFAAAVTLEEHGLLTADVFWEQLRATRPRRAAEIANLRQRLAVAAPLADASPLTILLASASPDHAERLRVDIEFRSIAERLARSRHRDRLRLIQLPAARLDDLRTALLEHEPQVLHLSCHGNPDGTLLLEPGPDGSDLLPKASLLRLLRALADKLRLVVINACHSAAIAHDIPPTIGLSIGMESGIPDPVATAFSVALYEALAFGKTPETAFELALSAMGEHDSLPQLFPPPDNDSSRNRALPLIGGLG